MTDDKVKTFIQMELDSARPLSERNCLWAGCELEAGMLGGEDGPIHSAPFCDEHRAAQLASDIEKFLEGELLTNFKFTPEDFYNEHSEDWGFTEYHADEAARIANARLREWLERAPTKQAEELVNRFLAWPLPKSVCSDPCVMDTKYPNRIGTNLLTADEARQMLEHVLEGARLVCVEQLSNDKNPPSGEEGEK